MGKLTITALAIEVRAMRNAQIRYFEMIAKAKKSKTPEDFANANAALRTSKHLEKTVDDKVREIMALEGAAG